jgi:5-methylcytosine-specific restriction endonuclease McrA
VGWFCGNGVRNGRKRRRTKCRECMRGKRSRDRARRAVLMEKGAGRVTDEDIRRIGDRQGWVCACGCGRNVRWEYHIDHVVALSRGGVHDRSNIQLLAPICNLKKGNR